MTTHQDPDDLTQAAAEFRRRYFGPRNNPGPPAAMAELAPRVTELVDAVVYGEIYNRPAVNVQTRSLCTIAALTVLGHSSQLIRRHIQGALNVGVTQEQISEIISQMVIYGGMPAAVRAFQVAKETFDELAGPRREESGDSEAAPAAEPTPPPERLPEILKPPSPPPPPMDCATTPDDLSPVVSIAPSTVIRTV